jgi:hypothetical protein
MGRRGWVESIGRWSFLQVAVRFFPYCFDSIRSNIDLEVDGD